MKTIEQTQQYLKELKEKGQNFTPLNELFFEKDSKRLTIHGYIVANMMWEGIIEGSIPLRDSAHYKEYKCNDGLINQAMNLLDKQSDLCYFIDSEPNASDTGDFIIKCFGDINSFEKLLKLSNGDFVSCVKKMSKRKK